MRVGIAAGAALCLGLLLPASGPARADAVEDELGQVVQEVEGDGATIDFLYDEEGRVIAEIHPDGTEIRYWYDEEGNRYEVGEEP